MDSLQPLLTHRFWLCFGVAVVLIPVGWWMGSSSLAREITKNKGEIEAAENGIPKGADHPNKDWIAGLAKVVEKRKEYHDRHAAELWDMQRSVMKKMWPPSVEPAMREAKYFGPGTDENARDRYRTVYYHDTIDELYKIVDPIGVNGQTWMGYDPETRKVTGKVVFNYETLPKVPVDLWSVRNPEWREMWDAQLDAWLLKALLESIKRVNDRRGTKNVYDASIRQIVTLMLRGGSPKTEAAATTSSDGSSPAADMMANASKAQFEYSSAAGGRTTIGGQMVNGGQMVDGGGLAGEGSPLPTGFVDDVFGKEVPREGTAKDGASPGGQEGPAGGNPANMMDMMRRGGGGGVSGAKSNMSPYVDNDPEMPFKTRGFVLQVLMNRKDLPLLVQELTDANESKFPVEILMIQEVDRDVDHTGLAVRSRVGGSGEPGAGIDGADDRIGGAGGARNFPPQMAPRIGGGISPLGGSVRPLGGSVRPLGGGVRPLGGGVRPLGGGAGPMEEGAGPDAPQAATNGPWAGALKDPGLGYVVIAGLMTIYQPPKETPKKAATTTSTQSKPTDTKPAGGKIPVSPTGGAKRDNKPKTPGKAAPQSAAKGNPTPAGNQPKQPAQPAAKSGKPVPGPKAGVPNAKAPTPGSAAKLDPKTKPPATPKKATAIPGKS
jgi:hypothetical protein